MVRIRTWYTPAGKCRFIRLYAVWCSMRNRCHGKSKDNHNYRDRGIFVCPEWFRFETFRDWALANGYRKGLTLERVNNDGPYSPSNCCFVPKPQQGKNTRRLKLYTLDGETLSIAQWARRLGLTPGSMQYRLKNWDLRRALTTPKVT